MSIAIIGSGFSGLGMAIRLKQRGIDDFVVYERAHDLGGTWRDNTYPGCACDVESMLYSYSFAPNPTWSRMFSPQREIWDYLKRCAQEFGILPHIRFGHDLKRASWDETKQRWHLQTSQGDFESQVLVSGMGAFNDPLLPKVPGLETFQGKMFHSAQWDHDYALEGKRVAVIGTGASAIQFVPAIQPKVSKLILFQRTPPWIVPRPDRAVTRAERKLFGALPGALQMRRRQIYWLREGLGLAFRRPNAMMPTVKQVALTHLRRAVKDPELRKKLTPNYTIGCKRILLSNDYYPALVQPNVEIVTDGVQSIGADSITTEDGRSHSVDAIIFGTGFRVTEMPFSRNIFGREGGSLYESWHGSPKAYLGTAVHGFPNLFLLLGPNTALGHSSVVLMIEAQIEHVLKAVDHLRTQGLSSIEPSREAQERYIADIDRRAQRTVWTTGGCKSWYLDVTGRNSTLWPLSVGAFERRLREFRATEYEGRHA